MNWQTILLALVPTIVGFASAALTMRFATIQKLYLSSVRPPGSPPAWLFGPVWTILYALMGASVSAFYNHTKQVPWVFWIQLILNAAWTPVFFALRLPVLALGILVAIIMTSAMCAWIMYREVPWTGILWIPYIVWLLYAGYLNSFYATYKSK